jgi:hypothetical protein
MRQLEAELPPDSFRASVNALSETGQADFWWEEESQIQHLPVSPSLLSERPLLLLPHIPQPPPLPRPQ